MEEEKKESKDADCCEKNKCGCEKYKKHLPKIIATVLLVVVLGGFAYYKLVWKKHNLSEAEAKTKVEDFINNNLMQGGMKANIASVTKENGMFKVAVEIGEGTQKQTITSYLSVDGTKFFPSVMDIAEIEQKAKPDASQAAAAKQADIPKTDKPTVELFVMSYCPYGTQIEKGIIPAITALGAKINYTLKFVSYSMHNDLASNDRKELDENLRQYCIQKNQPAKLSTYLTCFLKVGKGTETSCMQSAGVNAATVASCMTQADKQFNVTKDFQDKSTYQGTFPMFEVNKADNDKYGVKGSPTLVINGAEASAAGRDSASLLKTICSGFKTAPKECSTTLSTTAPASGFGEGTAPAGSGAAAGAACGN
ncbi:MAG: hypothetical protein NTY33_01095 [Candidatus Moranbacteria bacterium]|nr:hypothetical protein [Candidatus Moranbacteria bacterium]